MGITDYVRVVVSLSGAVTISRQGFGVMLLAGYHTHWTNGDRVRFYPASSALTQLASDGFLTTEPIFRAVEAMLASPVPPAQIAIGRRALPMTQVLKLKLTDSVVGDPYAVTVVGSDGVSHTYTLVSTGVPATDAATFAALMTATNIGTVTVSTDTITVTQTSGKLTDFRSWTPNFSVSNTTADPGIAADLVAILAVNTLGWYGVALDSNSKAEVEAACAFVEATGQGGKVGFFDNSDAANVTSGSGDLFSDLEADGYLRSLVRQSNKAVLNYGGAALGTQLLAMNPGAWAAAYKSTPGVPADDDTSLTETQRLILNTMSTSQPGTGGKNGNYYVSTSGLLMTWPGVTPGGRFFDITVSTDWLQVNIQADLLAYVASLPKIPLDDIGIGGAGDVVKRRMKIFAAPPYGGIEDASIVVTVPTAASLSDTDRANRNLSGLGASAKLSGAIATVGGGTGVQVEVSP